MSSTGSCTSEIQKLSIFLYICPLKLYTFFCTFELYIWSAGSIGDSDFVTGETKPEHFSLCRNTLLRTGTNRNNPLSDVPRAAERPGEYPEAMYDHFYLPIASLDGPPSSRRREQTSGRISGVAIWSHSFHFLSVGGNLVAQ